MTKTFPVGLSLVATLLLVALGLWYLPNNDATNTAGLPSTEPVENRNELTDSQDENGDDPARSSGEFETNLAPVSGIDSPPWRIQIDDEKVGFKELPGPPGRPIADLYPDLHADAMDGDVEAAFYLSRAIRFCGGAPNSQQEYETELLELQTTRKVLGLIQTDDTRPAERLLKKRYDICAGIRDVLQADADEYLKIAADGGLSEAQVAYAHYQLGRVTHDTPTEIIDSVLQYLYAARDGGNADAYYWTGFHGTNGKLEESPKTALADLIVADAVFIKFDIRNLRTLIDQEYQMLMPHERTEVVRLANERAAAKNCCTLVYGRAWESTLRDE